jgi:hypothetical protein
MFLCVGVKMRTTIDIRDDLLQAVREHAAIEHVSLGELLSRWAERGRYAASHMPADVVQNAQRHQSGFRVLLKKRAEVVTTEHVRRLMDEEGI